MAFIRFTPALLIWMTILQLAEGAGNSGYIYWGTNVLVSGLEKKIQRAYPDGTNIEDLVVGLNLDPLAIAVNPENDHLYWTDAWQGKIYRSNRDGSEMTTILSVPQRVSWGLAIEQRAQEIYWTDFVTNSIRRMNLDGSNLETIVGSAGTAAALVIHHQEGRLYWAQRTGGKILRSNLDGSDA